MKMAYLLLTCMAMGVSTPVFSVEKTGCTCTKCACTPDNHCGCYSDQGCKCMKDGECCGNCPKKAKENPAL